MRTLDYCRDYDTILGLVRAESEVFLIEGLLQYSDFTADASRAGINERTRGTSTWFDCSGQKTGLYEERFLRDLHALYDAPLRLFHTRIWHHEPGLFTPLHWEGVRNTFMNSHISGKKRWIVITGATRCVASHWMHVPTLLLSKELKPSQVEVVEVGPNQTIFMPKGTYHAVEVIQGPAVNIDLQYVNNTVVPRELVPTNFYEEFAVEQGYMELSLWQILRARAGNAMNPFAPLANPLTVANIVEFLRVAPQDIVIKFWITFKLCLGRALRCLFTTKNIADLASLAILVEKSIHSKNPQEPMAVWNELEKAVRKASSKEHTDASCLQRDRTPFVVR